MKCLSFSISLSLVVLLSHAQSEFTKIVDPQNPILTTTIRGVYKGASWVDFDNDGDLDLYMAPNFLFRNEGGKKFTKLENPFGFTPQQGPGGASWADLNNDGFIDCIIAQNPSGVYLNNGGNGTFKSITDQIPGLLGYVAWGCAIGNLNGDDIPDLTFVHARGFHSGPMTPSKVYVSTGALSYAPVTGLILTDSLKPYTVPYWSDYDQDGDMDLFVASGPGGRPGPDFCYKNMRVETGKPDLKPMVTEKFATLPQDGQCYNFVDVDNDRDLDLCLTNYGGASTNFYRNTNGVFAIENTPFTAQTRNIANNWGDFDNDGDLDVIITSDAANAKYYKNNGGGIFSSAINLGKAGVAGISNGDYDNDGDLDIFIHGVDTAKAIFENGVSKNANSNWISIKCVGTKSGKTALGTMIMAKSTIGKKEIWQTREINAQNSFLSQNDLRVHIGVGDAKVIDTIIIKYPTGTSHTFNKVKVNSFFSHEEGSKNLAELNASK